jgi:hypothetical protein
MASVAATMKSGVRRSNGCVSARFIHIQRQIHTALAAAGEQAETVNLSGLGASSMMGICEAWHYRSIYAAMRERKSAQITFHRQDKGP